MKNTYLPKSSLLAKAVSHNDRKLMYMMAESLNGDAPKVTWAVVPLESMQDAEEAPSAQ
jgi:hypothetical protein